MIIKIKKWKLKLLCVLKPLCDCPEPVQMMFQDPASRNLESIITFNNHILSVIFAIVLLIGWFIITSIIFYYEEFVNSFTSKFVHSKILEFFWTLLPILVILSLAMPSFTLLYSMEELTNPDLTLKVIGHQWFWSYEISDFDLCLNKKQFFKYTCYMLIIEGLPKSKLGYLRLLETNKRVLLPTNVNLRLLISAVDVLHSWTIPSLGIKVDACPGRLNQLNTFLKRIGVFFGQCSEICGINHGFMPIVIVSLTSNQFYNYILTKAV